jgi:hypothetical protein
MPTETLTRATPTMLFKSVLKYQHPGTPGPPGEATSAKQTIGSIITNPVKKAVIFFIIFHLLSASSLSGLLIFNVLVDFN